MSCPVTVAFFVMARRDLLPVRLGTPIGTVCPREVAMRQL
jgi:hypothetical protein